jgi:HD-GYP domain-containing protein (c-di-GMP phosphodiesterase class II)
MIEIPIDFVRPGDVLGKNHSFKRFDGGMSATVDLMDGYHLTQRVLDKLKGEFRVEHLCIREPSDAASGVRMQVGFDEIARQKIVSSFHDNVGNLERAKIIDITQLHSVAYEILDNVSAALKAGKGNFRSLSRAFVEVRSHDAYTWEHSVNTAIYAAIIALADPSLLSDAARRNRIRYNTREEDLVLNMLLHDLGKIRVPLRVLNKKEPLTESEVGTISRHPYDGFQYVRNINKELTARGMLPIPSYLLQACLLHHQAYDGTGYPALRAPESKDVRPLTGPEIPIIGRIAAVADMFDALSSNRPYRLPYHPADALKILLHEQNKKLDPRITQLLVDQISPFPVGTTVMLSTGELGLIVGHQDQSQFRPIVRPLMRKIKKGGKEQIIRLHNRDDIPISPESKVRIVVNKKLYKIASRHTDQRVAAIS